MATLLGAGASQAQGASRTFLETGNTVSGASSRTGTANGGLAQQGYPYLRGDAGEERHRRQDLHRAILRAGGLREAPREQRAERRAAVAARQVPLQAEVRGQRARADAKPRRRPRLFPETGKRVGGVFLDYWQSHGGLAQQGYPISDEFMERSALDGKTYTVQYFERAVFEYHPENAAPYEVLLSQLGTFKDAPKRLYA